MFIFSAKKPLNCHLLQSKMRIGLAEKSVQMALAQAAVYSEKGSPPKNVHAPFEEVDALISSTYMFTFISYLSV